MPLGSFQWMISSAIDCSEQQHIWIVTWIQLFVSFFTLIFMSQLWQVRWSAAKEIGRPHPGTAVELASSGLNCGIQSCKSSACAGTFMFYVMMFLYLNVALLCCFEPQSLLSHYRDYGLQRLDLGVATWWRSFVFDLLSSISVKTLILDPLMNQPRFVDHFHNAAELATYVASNGSSTNKTPIFPGSPPVTPSQSLATKDARARPQAHDLASQPNPFSWAALNHGKAFEHIGWELASEYIANSNRIVYLSVALRLPSLSLLMALTLHQVRVRRFFLSGGTLGLVITHCGAQYSLTTISQLLKLFFKKSSTQ
jgi:hypothetical protein